jgi:ferrous iron transport protein B
MNAYDRCIAVIGKESAGKSQLISSLTGQQAYVSNFRGATITCDIYDTGNYVFVDTPGILRHSDTLTTKAALAQLKTIDTIMLVVQATHIDDDLDDLLPLVKEKRGTVIVTFWDKVHMHAKANETLDDLCKSSELNIIPVDARHIDSNEKEQILNSLKEPVTFTQDYLRFRTGWRVEPPPSLLEKPYLGQIIAILLLLFPAMIAVWLANTFAESIDPFVQRLIAPVADSFSTLPSLLKEVLTGNYGLITMGPLLFVWAVPTVILYALFIGSYKASGLIDRISTALHPIMRPFGLSGRDVVRVMMGFGCNVPAVINTRACSACSRRTCISAIAFGSACSYQLGATLGVFAAARMPYLVIPYLLFLVTTTLIYIKFTAPPVARSSLNVLMNEGHTFIERPRLADVWRESRSTIVQFFSKAIPIFCLITVVASVLNWLGVISIFSNLIKSALAIFHLPADAALPVLLASIRKDGILLFAKQGTVSNMSAGQILTGVYLAGVLLPCLVTLLTIAREDSLKFAVKLASKQAFAACCFAFALAWSTVLFGW